MESSHFPWYNKKRKPSNFPLLFFFLNLRVLGFPFLNLNLLQIAFQAACGLWNLTTRGMNTQPVSGCQHMHRHDQRVVKTSATRNNWTQQLLEAPWVHCQHSGQLHNDCQIEKPRAHNKAIHQHNYGWTKRPLSNMAYTYTYKYTHMHACTHTHTTNSNTSASIWNARFVTLHSKGPLTVRSTMLQVTVLLSILCSASFVFGLVISKSTPTHLVWLQRDQ